MGTELAGRATANFYSIADSAQASTGFPTTPTTAHAAEAMGGSLVFRNEKDVVAARPVSEPRP